MAQDRRPKTTPGVTGPFLSGLAKCAHDGTTKESPDAARALLAEFLRDASGHLKTGEPFRLEPLQFVFDSLSSHLQGKDIAQAFGIKRKKQATNKQSRDVEMAVSVLSRMGQGMTLEKAAAQVAPLYRYSPGSHSKVVAAYSKYKKTARIRLSLYQEVGIRPT